MTGQPRPLMLGYLRVHELASNADADQIREPFESFAEREGYALGHVFIEQDCTAPGGFTALIDAVKSGHAQAVAVPSLEHLAVLGAQPPLDEFLQRATGAQVLVMDAAGPPQTGGASAPSGTPRSFRHPTSPASSPGGRSAS
ncbi:MAG TPA: hypothetical protein VGJ41_02235 [Nocardioides sp.]